MRLTVYVFWVGRRVCENWFEEIFVRIGISRLCELPMNVMLVTSSGLQSQKVRFFKEKMHGDILTEITGPVTIGIAI